MKRRMRWDCGTGALRCRKTGKRANRSADFVAEKNIVSITPLIFALLGTALVLRFNRGGKGFGIVLALAGLVIYYLIALFGEQLARTGEISVLGAGRFRC